MECFEAKLNYIQKTGKCTGKRAKRAYSFVITKDVQSVPIAGVVKEKRTDHEKSENTR